MSEAYTVPGVYVTENNGASLSIQHGETAVPVFVGFFNAKKRPEKSAPLACVRIESWLDFTQQFGPSDRIKFELKNLTLSSGLAKDNVISQGHATSYAGSHCIRLYFENGGGPCYILNLEREAVDPQTRQIAPAIELCPDITLLCWCEFVDQAMDQSIYTALGTLLAATPTSGGNPGRFMLTDAWPTGASDSPSQWEFKAPTVAEKTQVASYFPALLTAHTRDYSEYLNEKHRHWISCNLSEAQLKLLKELGVKPEHGQTTVTLSQLIEHKGKISTVASGGAELASIIDAVNTHLPATIAALQEKADPVLLRASVAMAGIYARVDRERGVWKAPANVGIAGVTALLAEGFSAAGQKWDPPVPVRIDDALNAKLIETDINAIRAFRGQGIVVWGARTMTPSGQTDWRYVSVRRLFNTLERDARATLRTVVFEPNSPVIWEQVRGALDNYLNALWRQGALQGDTAAQAYYVQIGLGTTMSKEDIDSGRMIVKIGVAAVRPAEFIVLQLTQDVSAG